jgi:hypothetical protein
MGDEWLSFPLVAVSGKLLFMFMLSYLLSAFFRYTSHPQSPLAVTASIQCR